MKQKTDKMGFHSTRDYQSILWEVIRDFIFIGLFIIFMFLLVKMGLFAFFIGDTPIIPLSFGYFWVIFSSIIGLVCVAMARARGRGVVLGFLGGYFLGIVAVVYYLLVGDVVEVRIRKEEYARKSIGDN